MVGVSLCIIYSWSNSISRTLLLGLPQKESGQPVESIMLLTLISKPKFGLQHILRFLYGLLLMAKLPELLLNVRDTGKAQNQKVTKLWMVFVKVFALA